MTAEERIEQLETEAYARIENRLERGGIGICIQSLHDYTHQLHKYRHVAIDWIKNIHKLYPQHYSLPLRLVSL
jgi:hypothetical protein